MLINRHLLVILPNMQNYLLVTICTIIIVTLQMSDDLKKQLDHSKMTRTTTKLKAVILRYKQQKVLEIKSKIQCTRKWGPWTGCSSNNGPGVQIRFDEKDHTIQDVQACDGRVPTGKTEPLYGPCSKTCGGGKRPKYQLGKI